MNDAARRVYDAAIAGGLSEGDAAELAAAEEGLAGPGGAPTQRPARPRPAAHDLDGRRALALGEAGLAEASGYTPPSGVVANAKRALTLIRDGKAGPGFSSVGRARARQLASGASVSMATVRAMNAYFARHGASSQQEDHSGTSPAAVAWLAWGGDAGKRWAASIVKAADDAAVGAGLDVFSPPQLEASVWHAPHGGQKCSRWASQHSGSTQPPAVACREEGGRHLGACAAHKREMTRGQRMADEDATEDEVLAAGLALTAWRDHLAGRDLDALDGEDAEALLVLEGGALKKRSNWVEQTGGLPNLIRRVADHLIAKGMTESHAIATAVNVVKKYCSRGDLNFPGKQNVSAKTKASGCKAVAEWNAKRARARAT